MEDYGNAQVGRLPRRLRAYVIDQHYEKYTAVDQAVWRYVMRQNYHYLKDIAYYPYIKGLTRAGLSIERIPDLLTMNQHLAEIGWGAVTVDGFIPPAAFMEFQAYKVLVIAAEIRQLKHIQYTPTPDIIHESAGHAPIIADPQYAEYLRYFGEIGTKALFSRQDFELYESIRKLSILKEMPGSKDAEIELMEKEVERRQQNMGAPSEMALLSRLHWWTVEYGMIGTLDTPKIYGAGLLSSIGESVSCMQPSVKKRLYTSDAITVPFDITREQPQLFVTPDFENLMKVLNDFVSGMAFRKGGLDGLKKGKDCGNVCTVKLDSGIQVTGIIDTYLIENDKPVYIRFRQPSALSYDNKELPGMSRHRFPEGICFPLGGIAGFSAGLQNCTDADLHELGLTEGEYGMLEYESGWIFHGTLKRIRHQDGKPVLLTWLDAELMDPDVKIPVETWEYFELPLGSTVTSVFNGAADKDTFEDAQVIPEPSAAINPLPVEALNPFISSYSEVRAIREKLLPADSLESAWQTIQTDLTEGWLCALEILELVNEDPAAKKLSADITERLQSFAAAVPAYRKLIADGLELIGSSDPVVQQ